MPFQLIPESIDSRAIMFEISRHIVDVIVGEMFYFPENCEELEDGPTKIMMQLGMDLSLFLYLRNEWNKQRRRKRER